jgi:hypothetical protein
VIADRVSGDWAGPHPDVVSPINKLAAECGEGPQQSCGLGTPKIALFL